MLSQQLYVVVVPRGWSHWILRSPFAPISCAQYLAWLIASVFVAARSHVLFLQEMPSTTFITEYLFWNNWFSLYIGRERTFRLVTKSKSSIFLTGTRGPTQPAKIVNIGTNVRLLIVIQGKSIFISAERSWYTVGPRRPMQGLLKDPCHLLEDQKSISQKQKALLIPWPPDFSTSATKLMPDYLPCGGRPTRLIIFGINWLRDSIELSGIYYCTKVHQRHDVVIRRNRNRQHDC